MSLKLYNNLFDDLDDGNGVCRYFDKEKYLCTIYDIRPWKCRVDEAYERLYKGILSYDEYITKTKQCCLILQKFQRDKKKPDAKEISRLQRGVHKNIPS